MSGCPSEEQLASFAAGVCAAGGAKAIQDHVASCARCRSWLEQQRDADAWLEGVRAVAGQGPFEMGDHARPTESRKTTTSGDGPPDARQLPSGVPEVPDCEIVRELSHGGQGVVYEAIQKSTKRKVAVKLLHTGASGSKAARRRFEREVELIAQLRHPNIIAIFQSGVLGDGRQYYVMDYIRGVPLHRYVREKKLALEEALANVRSALEAQMAGSSVDLLAIDVTTAVNALGEITGETASDDLLEVIFSQFCVGK